MPDTETLNDDLAVELDALTRAGFDEVIVVDLTRRELRIPVVRVVVPGLESSSAEATCYSTSAAERLARGLGAEG